MLAQLAATERTLLTAVLLVARAWGDIISQIEDAIIGFFSSIWNGIQSFFGTVFGAISNTFAAIFSAPVNAIESSFGALETFADQFGPLAPIIVIAVVAAVLLLATWLIWIIIKVSVSEGEQTGEEAEEGV